MIRFMDDASRAVTNNQAQNLRAELQRARQGLMDAEADLAREQAAVNAFRMHCRLKLDLLIDNLLALQAEKEACLTQWELRQQAQELGVPLDDDFWETTAQETATPQPEEALLLPTDTPRDKAAEKRLYRELARRFHPDLAETAVEQAYRTTIMAAVNAAYTNGDAQALYDLAGELDPAEIAELQAIETIQLRRLREQILHARRRQRRAQQRLRVLQEENTARLYYKAQALDEGSVNWWSLVQREIEVAILRRREEVAALKERLMIDD